KIRRQIRDCALFVPIISGNSEARPEGYFRLEWDLADQRSHMIVRHRPFIMPATSPATYFRCRMAVECLTCRWVRREPRIVRVSPRVDQVAEVECVRRFRGAVGLRQKAAPFTPAIARAPGSAEQLADDGSSGRSTRATSRRSPRRVTTSCSRP